MAKKAHERATKGFQDWIGGEPDAVLEGPETTDAGDAIHILYFADEIEDDEEDEAGPITYIVTAGLSATKLFRRAPSETEPNPPKTPAELVLCVRAPLEDPEMEQMGAMLAQVCTAIIKDDVGLACGSFAEIGPMPIFHGMSWVFLSEWSEADSRSLPGVLPRTAVWNVTPIYEQEIEAITEQAGTADEIFELFADADLDPDDPDRPPLVDLDPEDLNLDGMDGLDLAKCIEAMMGGIQSELETAMAEEGEEDDFQGAQEMILYPVDPSPAVEFSMTDGLDPSGDFHPGWLPDLGMDGFADKGKGLDIEWRRGSPSAQPRQRTREGCVAVISNRPGERLRVRRTCWR